MSRNGKVIIAMSGGVDSSVAACLLKEQGYECTGVFMRTGVHAPEPAEQCATDAAAEHPRGLKHGCCSAADALDARAVAGRLGIPFYALNFEQDFERIINSFVDEYARGRTPNPCVLCNVELKFGKLLRYADLMEAEFIATGHYARVLRRDGQTLLARAANLAKDQSYLLFGIERTALSRCLFPLGEMRDKAQVRSIAAALGLRVHDKPDSQEICFVPGNDYKELLRERRPETQRAGEVRDPTGRVLGTHAGIANYTIGQRQGLGIATGRPAYVTRLDVLNNVVTLGPREDLLSPGLLADQVNWLTEPPAVGQARPASTKIRHTHNPAAGSIRRQPDGNVEACFDEPQLAVTPGQAAVFYEADVVLGGGWIVRASERPSE
jgi:tRNA-uridine 2-sulfurtransferase